MSNPLFENSGDVLPILPQLEQQTIVNVQQVRANACYECCDSILALSRWASSVFCKHLTLVSISSNSPLSFSWLHSELGVECLRWIWLRACCFLWCHRHLVVFGTLSSWSSPLLFHWVKFFVVLHFWHHLNVPLRRPVIITTFPTWRILGNSFVSNIHWHHCSHVWTHFDSCVSWPRF